MTPKPVLEPTEREFMRLVARAAYCNPFSDQRAELDSQIIGRPVKSLAEVHLDEMTRVISGHVQKLEQRGLADVRRYTGADREMMQAAFLFEIYHEFRLQFDQLIIEQFKLGEESAPVPFGAGALDRMRHRGFGVEESVRLLSIFYQLRRAFHFIVRGLVGRSPCMGALRRHLWNNVFTHDLHVYDRHLWNRMEDFSTLLLGETGSGKGAAAAAIGRSGYIPFDPRRGRFAESFLRTFTALNLSQFPETLIESELFGHRKGAFTGAVEAHEGVLARCSAHGAVFLDEIGDVSVPVQIKLLQVLQQRTFCPVGSHEPARFSGRVIAATNRPLETLRSRGLFREDFFYRLCSDVIRVPPLRERLQEDPSELRQLLEHTIAGILGEPAAGLVDLMEGQLRRTVAHDYAWPGNVRELEQAVRRILLTRDYAGSAEPRSTGLLADLIAGLETGNLDADALLGGYCALLHERSGSYEAVARQTNLDRRTVKKYVLLRSGGDPGTGGSALPGRRVATAGEGSD